MRVGTTKYDPCDDKRFTQLHSNIPIMRRNDLLWKLFISAKYIDTDDSRLYKYRNYVNIRSYNMIPTTIPTYFKFIDYGTPWNDENIKPNTLIFVSDGSVYFYPPGYSLRFLEFYKKIYS